MRSSPLDSEMYRMQCGTALAHMCAGRFDEAAPWAEKSFREFPELSYGGLHYRGELMHSRAEWTKRNVQ